MFEKIENFRNYFPITINDVNFENFVNHHYDHLSRCVINELYSSALMHLHILYMIFVYIHIHRIAQKDRKSFKMSLIGFPRDEKSILSEPDYPLLLSVINEKTVFRFFRLNNFDENLIGEISSPVNLRNDCLHASGKIECESEEKLEKELDSYIQKMDKIILGNGNILSELYEEYAQDSLLLDPDFKLTDDDIEMNILLTTYFSLIELNLVTKGRTDKVSNYIIGQFILI